MTKSDKRLTWDGKLLTAHVAGRSYAIHKCMLENYIFNLLNSDPIGSISECVNYLDIADELPDGIQGLISVAYAEDSGAPQLTIMTLAAEDVEQLASLKGKKVELVGINLDTTALVLDKPKVFAALTEGLDLVLIGISDYKSNLHYRCIDGIFRLFENTSVF